MFTEKKIKIYNEICNHCGKDVSWGSGNFINRVFDGNDIITRRENSLKFILGDFVCEGCDTNSEADND